jgi:predicted subunit of tRNA(5-methylaminomethyl-2-thiouridylate) methyltransferase
MPDRLAEIRARLDAATVAGWGDEKWVETFTPLRSVGARFIAHAPADIAWLLAELERYRADEAERVRISGELRRLLNEREDD